MKTEEKITEDTIEKLKKLLGSINGIKSTKDLYSLCINQSLKNAVKG